nr:toprim domain-containing protein [Calditrichia bacterium]
NFIQQNKLPQKHFETLGLLLFSPKSGKPYDRFRNRIMFPIHDPGGQIIAFGGRTLDKDPQTPKYINSPESPVYYKSQVLYGLFQARQGIRESGKALFVEGYMDVIQLHQHGVGNAVATSGTALTEDHARLIRRYTEKVVLCYDADRAGISAAARGGEILFQNNLDVEVLILPQGEDPDSYVQKNGREAFVKLLGEAEDYLTFRIAQTRQEYDLSRASERSQAVNGLLDMLAPISDVIKANFYVERLSADLQLPATMLLSELQKKQKALQQRRRYQASVPVQTAEQPETPVRKPQKGDINVFTGAWGGEKDIILLLIRYYDNIQAYVYGHVENEDFQNPEFRQIFELLSGQEGVEGDALLHLVLNETESPELRNLLLREVEHANREFKKPAVYLQGCIRNLKMARYQAIIETGKHRLRNIKADDPNMLSVMREMRQAQIEYKKWKDVEPVDTDE